MICLSKSRALARPKISQADFCDRQTITIQSLDVVVRKTPFISVFPYSTGKDSFNCVLIGFLSSDVERHYMRYIPESAVRGKVSCGEQRGLATCSIENTSRKLDIVV